MSYNIKQSCKSERNDQYNLDYVDYIIDLSTHGYNLDAYRNGNFIKGNYIGFIGCHFDIFNAITHETYNGFGDVMDKFHIFLNDYDFIMGYKYWL